VSYGSGSGWLSLSKTNDSSLGAVIDGNAGDPITVSIDNSKLSSGVPYTATVKFSGNAIVNGVSVEALTPITLAVTYNGVGGIFSCPGDSRCPVCTLTPNPNAVTIPGTSILTYSCTNVNSCSDITGTDGKDLGPVGISGTAAAGSVTAAPTQNTTYSFTCTGSIGTGHTTKASASVSVTNPGIIECLPGENPKDCPNH